MVIFISIPSCTHDPIGDIVSDDNMEMDSMPADTIPDDNMNGDTLGGNPCEEDVIYFEMQVLPVLRSNCALSGCHNTASAQDGIVLENYESLLQSDVVEAFNLDESDLYEVLVEDKIEKRMPPAPRDPLLESQINLVRQWIMQGAQNLSCENTTCDLDNISFSNDVNPIIETFCKGCHSGPAPSGGVSLDNYNAILSVVNSGQLMGAISWSNGFVRMPQNQDKLDDCTIEKINTWINEGAKNN
jgi:hypothetical protein